MKGSGEMGFFSVLFTLSLIAVFIPLFLMSGYVGLLFREFAVAVSVSLILSLIIALTLTPMMCAHLLKPEHEAQHGRFYRLLEAAFDGLLSAYESGLKVVLRHRFLTLLVMPGLIIAVSQAADDISFQAMEQKMEAAFAIILKDPAVASIGAQIGASGAQTLNEAKMFITLKPESQRTASADQVIRRLGTKLASLDGLTVYMQAAQDITIGARVARTQYQYTLVDANAAELAHWTPIFLGKLRSLPQITDVASDQESAGPLLDVTVDREVASSYGILPATIDNTLDDAFGQRIVSTIYTTLNQYHVILEVETQFQLSPLALNRIYIPSATGQEVTLSQLVKSVVRVAPLIVNHQGQFPSVTLSFNLKPGVALGPAVNAIARVKQQLHVPASLATSFQGNAQASPSSLSSEPILIAATLVVIYIILGVLYESLVHPITIISTLPSAGLGALLMLIAFHFDLSVIAIIGIILLIGIVKKNGIMLIDFALEAERNQGLSPEE